MKEDRLETIAKALAERGEMTVKEISVMLAIPEPTIRRDLRKLHDQHRIRRMYGRAQSLEQAGATTTPPADQTKRQIANKALDQITAGNVVMLPRGPVNLEIARLLGASSHLTVITNSCAVFDCLKQTAGVHLMSLGGVYSQIGDCTYGQVAENSLLEIRADVLMLEPAGIDLNEGITHDNIVEVPLLKRMIRATRRVVVLARDDCFGKTSGAVVAPADIGSVVIASGRIPEWYEGFFAEHSIEVIQIPGTR